jgi:hypothetical protein
LLEVVIFGVPVAPVEGAVITLIGRVLLHRFRGAGGEGADGGVVEVDEVGFDRELILSGAKDLRSGSRAVHRSSSSAA